MAAPQPVTRSSLTAFKGWFESMRVWFGQDHEEDLRSAFEQGWHAGRAEADLQNFPDCQGGREQASKLGRDLEDAAMLVRRLSHALRGTDLSLKAWDWLKRKGLVGSILRTDAPPQAPSPATQQPHLAGAPKN